MPASASPANWEEVEQTAGTFGFPRCSRVRPNAVAPALQASGIELVKAEYVYTADEFLRVAERYRPVGEWPLVQEYCSGVGLGQFFSCIAARRCALPASARGRVAAGGRFSSVCDAVPLDRFVELQEKSIRLLQHIGWDGVAMVEYRYDPASGRVLMEANFLGSFPLAMYCGAGFGLFRLWLCRGRDRMPDLPPLRENLRCRDGGHRGEASQTHSPRTRLIRDRTFQVRLPAARCCASSGIFCARRCVIMRGV